MKYSPKYVRGKETELVSSDKVCRNSGEYPPGNLLYLAEMFALLLFYVVIYSVCVELNGCHCQETTALLCTPQFMLPSNWFISVKNGYLLIAQ